MVRRRSLRAALVVAATVLLSTAPAGSPAAANDPDVSPAEARAEERATTSAPSRAAVVSRQRARRAATTPLTVTIEALTPSAIPARGRVRVAGSVTNADSVPWLTVNVYSFISGEPMTTGAQLAAAAQVDESTSVGERITEVGNYDTIDAIGPGETQPFSFTVDAALLEADTPGVYWFGVHALGQRGDEGFDEQFLADGRARTFLPMVPAQREGQESVSVIVPLRGMLEYTADGSLDDLERWGTTLATGGRLRSLVELAATAGDRTVSWVVDPALLDAVRQLAAGNPPRSLEANLQEGEDDGEDVPSGSPSAEGTPGESPGETPGETPSDAPTETASETPSTEPEDDPTETELSEDLDPQTREVAEVAREWLGRLRGAMGDDDEVLVLPYGDLDVSAAARHDARAYARAHARSQRPLPGFDRATTPVVAPPSGYLSADSLRTVDQDTVVLVSDRTLAKAPPVATVAGRRLVMTSSRTNQGGPSPGDPRGAIALRQRILAEAAVRFLKPARSPLLVMLPPDWVPPASSSFFAGFDLDWLDLTSVAAATEGLPAEARSADEVRYPERQTAFELDAANFVAANGLRQAGERLQSLLTLNNLVSATVTDQALASTSYAARARPDSNRVATDRSRQWIEERMEEVRVTTPPEGVTLSSINGSFPVSITNELDQPVTVKLAKQGSNEDGLQIADVGEIDILPGASTTRLLEARTDTPGVHNVTIMVTDKAGRPLGGSDDLSIRSARVSNVIWLFLAAGIGLLFGTIAFRLVRRVRAARR